MNGTHINIEVVAITDTRKPLAKTERQQKAELFDGLAKTQFENGAYEKCVEYCDKAIDECELGTVLGTKGLAQLMLDKEIEGTETYINASTLVKNNLIQTVFLGN